MALSQRCPTHVLAKREAGSRGDDWTSLSRIRNLDELWPHWRNPGLAQRVNIDGTKDRAEPWPNDQTQRLLWFRRHGAQLWIPRLTELDALFRELRDPTTHRSRSSRSARFSTLRAPTTTAESRPHSNQLARQQNSQTRSQKGTSTMTDVLNGWLTGGPSGFTDVTQSFLATQNSQLSADIGAFSLNREAVLALVNGLETIRAAQLG